MGKSALPTSSDIAAILPSAISTASADDYVSSIVQEVHDRTGFSTFLASGSVARSFFPPISRSGQSVLELLDGLVTCTEVRIDYHGTQDQGTALTLGSEYNPLPIEAPDHGQPWTRILFVRSAQTPTVFDSNQYYDAKYALKTVLITGVWGYSTSIPVDLWIAVKDLAAAKCILQARRATGQRTTVKDDDVSVSYDAGNAAMKTEFDALNRMIHKYTRVF